MSDIVERARKVIELRGDTFSSYEVIGLLGQLADEIERQRHDNEVGKLAIKRAAQISGEEIMRLNAEIERLRGELRPSLRQ